MLMPVCPCRTAFALLATMAAAGSLRGEPVLGLQVRTEAGLVEGTTGADGHVRVFEGIPYAAPPVGDLRWRSPQPVAAWTGVRKAATFGPRCVQARVFDDMVFRDEPSEDCLYLNVWTPAASATPRLPVMVWIHGGGFVAGSASEPRQDGERLAAKGVVVVSINYRLGVFGFLSHPALTEEAGRGASGNYGLLDQVAALQWVRKNIPAFGGDPGNVTIFGESAGSFAVSALMVSPLARGLFHRVIGESGAFFTVGDQTLAPPSLSASEKVGQELATSLGASSLAALRAKSAEDVLKAAGVGPAAFRLRPNIDGYMLPRDAYAVFSGRKQNDVPLLAGWNADEVRADVVLAKNKPTAKTFAEQTRKRFAADADALLKVYPADSDGEALESAASLASDLFIGYATWKWVDMQAQTGRSPVFCYSFDRAIPVPADLKMDGVPATARDVGARHAGEIEYVFGALDSLPKVPWEPIDRKLSDMMMSYWTNFARSADPNGPGLPKWPRYDETGGHQVLHLGDEAYAAVDTRRPRYEVLDAIAARLRTR